MQDPNQVGEAEDWTRTSAQSDSFKVSFQELAVPSTEAPVAVAVKCHTVTHYNQLEVEVEQSTGHNTEHVTTVTN